MPQDPFERVQAFLSETRANPLALLLDLITLLPESLLQRAIWLAKHANEDMLRAFLIEALAKRLPTRADRNELTRHNPMPAGVSVEDVTVPEGKEAKKLIERLDEQQRYEVFDQLLVTAERSTGAVEESGAERSGDDVFRMYPGAVAAVEPPAPAGEASEASIDPPDIPRIDDIYFGGGTAAVGPGDDDDGFESTGSGDDDGFESVGPVADEGPTPAAPEPERPDVVNLGFSQKHTADTKLKKHEPLLSGQSYYFWLMIGKDVDEAAIGTPSPIDLKKLPEEAVLTIALFGFENELAITPGHDLGELQIRKDGKVKVRRQPVDEKAISLSADAPAGYLENYLLFPITVPKKEATYRLRCNIYCAQVLVQSYVVSAHVKRTSEAVDEACSQKLDYVLSQSLRASHLRSMTKEPHLLSLMVNNNGDGSHSFRFFGTDGAERFKDDARIDGQQLAGFLKQARRAMHKVSWDNENEWDNGVNYKYRYAKKNDYNEKKLAKDLAYLARAGWRIYSGFVSHLSTTAAELETLMANPGLLQIALKLSPRAVVPAAVIYDYAWMPDNFDFEKTDFALCETFSAALAKARNGGPSLEECDCFKGNCELKKEIAAVRDPDSDKTLADLPAKICPSGFWGYRHSLGLPLTLDGTNKDVPPVINFKDELQMVACVSTDPLFVERDSHLGRLQTLKNPRSALKFERDEDYKAIVRRLRKTTPHLLYFYCHGGIRANTELPYLEIGEKDRFGPEALIGEGISWKGPNPLVFINGCHTTSLNPEITLDFVSSFVQQSGAAGVIGTEITIFELLAAQFAEECFGRFVGAPPHAESMPIGRAVRGARLELLRQGNPLGLVYIPYAVASLRLQEAQ
jgi:hypothetical protein